MINVRRVEPEKLTIMKTKTYHIIFALIILMAATNVYADGNKGKKEKKSNSVSVIHKVEAAFEQELCFENWMLELKEFAGKEVFAENELTFETWMMHEFDTQNMINTQEDEMCFESWMMTPFLPGPSESFIEPEMEFESWMMEKF